MTLFLYILFNEVNLWIRLIPGKFIQKTFFLIQELNSVVVLIFGNICLGKSPQEEIQFASILAMQTDLTCQLRQHVLTVVLSLNANTSDDSHLFHHVGLFIPTNSFCSLLMTPLSDDWLKSFTWLTAVQLACIQASQSLGVVLIRPEASYWLAWWIRLTWV